MLLADVNIETVVCGAHLATVGAMILRQASQVLDLHMVLEGGQAAASLPDPTVLALVLSPTEFYDLGPN